MKRTSLVMVSSLGLMGVSLGWGMTARADEPAPVVPVSPLDTTPPKTSTDTPPTQVTPIPGPITESPAAMTPPENQPVMPVTPVAPVPAATDYDHSSMRHMNIGGALLLGGGYEQFTNSGLKDMTGNGGSWNARAVAGTREYVGLEAAYVGAARSINTLGLASNADLVSNGVEGALRLNVPVQSLGGRQLIEPFGFVGLGWQHYSITNSNTNTSDLADKDDVMTMPVGAGFEYAYGAFMADARFTYRETYYNDLMRTTGGKLNNWGVGTQVGVNF